MKEVDGSDWARGGVMAVNSKRALVRTGRAAHLNNAARNKDA